MSLPSLQAGLDKLAGVTKKDLAPVMENYVPAKDLAAHAASQAPDISTSATIAAIRDQVQVKFGSEKLGHLLSQYHTNRDRQMQTLTGLGKDVLLSLLSQGILPATLAKSLEVSYDVFHEFVRITCTKEEIKHMEALQADSLVAEGVEKLNAAEDKEDLAIAKAIVETNMKLAKALTTKYTEQKAPTTAVQVNNYGDTSSEEMQVSFVKFPQMTVPDVESLPALSPHAYKSIEEQHAQFEPEGFIDGEFTFTEVKE